MASSEIRVDRQLVSICLPAYMAEPYIADTIESVLSQTYQDWELMVLDNNSSDRTGEIAQSYRDPRITVHRNESTLSLADNWNAAVALADRPFVKLLCADDVLYPDCLAEEVAVLSNDDDVALVAAKRHFIDAAGELVLRDRGLGGLTGRRGSIETVKKIISSGINPIGCPSAMMFRRSAFDAAGGFDSRWYYTLDLEMAIRLLEHGAFHGIGRSLSAFRISPTSESSTLTKLGAQHRAMLRHVTTNSNWPVGMWGLVRGVVLSEIESIRRRLLFQTVNSNNRLIRRIPRVMLAGNTKPVVQGGMTGTAVG